jgi:hypothetical protein
MHGEVNNARRKLEGKTVGYILTNICFLHLLVIETIKISYLNSNFFL